MKWTKEQEHIIRSRNKNILVSAAAGSGKTAVLIERIKQLVIKDHINIDEFLITTFTNAASSEMKERLNIAVKEEIKTNRGDVGFLRKQLSMIPRANIGTFHNFSLEIIKRYFYFTDLEPGFAIGDDTQVSIIKKESINELFERRFEYDYDEFSKFLEKYSTDKSEEKLKNNIINIYDELRSIPWYMSWAEEKKELLKSLYPSDKLGIVKCVIENAAKNIYQAAKFYEDAAETAEKAGVESIFTKAEQDAEMVRDAAEKINTISIGTNDGSISFQNAFKETADIFQKFGFNTMRASKAEQENYNDIKDQVSGCRKKGKKLIDDTAEKYFSRDLEDYDTEMKDLYPDTGYYVGLLKEFEEIYKVKKSEKNIIDFDDVMHYALEILQNDMVAEEYKSRFKYIFIDEFQDSNMLQESIIDKIARENNVFMVGDVKQSIYKFRLAEPEIFKRKYEKYSRKTEMQSEKTDLNSNFRSKHNVIKTVNEVFSDIMDDYGENEKLYCGIGKEHEGFKSRMTLVDKKSKGDDDFLENEEAEAEIISNIIKETKGKTIYDLKKKTYRKLEYKDIVVLSRNRNSISLIEKHLNNSGIPAFGDNTGGYFESVEIEVFVNLLKIIDNTRRDIPLISVMRSMIFDFSARELAQIRIEFDDGSFFSAVEKYAYTGSDERIKNKINKLIESLKYWKALNKTVTLEELIRRLLYETGYFDYCSGLPVARQRISNLRLIVEKASEFEEKNYSGLYGFLTYVEAMKKNNIPVGEAKIAADDEDVVRIMTIHKSKGLEFPIVILSGAGRKIKSKGIGMGASLHKDLGIGLPTVNKKEGWHRKTLLQRAIEMKKAQEETEEEIRILYVALTRAMDKIEVTGSIDDAERLDENNPGKRTFVDMMYPAFIKNGDVIQIKNIKDLKNDKDMYFTGKLSEKKLLRLISEQNESELYNKIDKRLSYVYPYTLSQRVKSKYSVTELNNYVLGSKKTEELKQPDFSLQRKGLSPAEAGTVMHRIMEKIDFKKAFLQKGKYIKERIIDLKNKGVLTEEEKKYADIESIVGFFDSQIGKRAALAMNSEKEREFILLKNIDGEDTIVQGVIDFFFEEKDGFVLIDYKNSYIDNERDEDKIVERYKEQIALYKEALEESKGKKVKEAYLYMFRSKNFIKVR